jgi:DNA primase large subunit
VEQLSTAYRYPFTSYGKKEISSHGQLLRNDYLISEARNRLIDVVSGDPYPIVDTESGERQAEELAIYAICRLVITNLNNNYATNRFAVAYSKSIYAKRIENREMDDELLMLLREFGINAERADGNYVIDIFSFVKYSPDPVHYNLFYREVKDGAVKVTFEELKRMVQEAIKRHLLALPRIEKKDHFYSAIGQSVLSKLPKKEGAKVSFQEGDNPPCIEKLLDEMRMHKNLNHYARWSLAVYLMNRDVSLEDMLRIFANAPDYSEKVSTYQIKHVIEHGYKMPTCDKMKLYGLCVAECGIGNPIRWRGKGGSGKKVDK